MMSEDVLRFQATPRACALHDFEHWGRGLRSSFLL
jgi:hypothetical protein